MTSRYLQKYRICSDRDTRRRPPATQTPLSASEMSIDDVDNKLHKALCHPRWLKWVSSFTSSWKSLLTMMTGPSNGNCSVFSLHLQTPLWPRMFSRFFRSFPECGIFLKEGDAGISRCYFKNHLLVRRSSRPPPAETILSMRSPTSCLHEASFWLSQDETKFVFCHSYPATQPAFV